MLWTNSSRRPTWLWWLEQTPGGSSLWTQSPSALVGGRQIPTSSGSNWSWVLLLFPVGDEDEDCGEEKLPSGCDYVMHFLTVFWKLLFAFVPPTDYWNGWACFVISIVVIGLLTAVIGDLASHFGCTIGLKDSVTAVVFVALGTSVPGVFFYPFQFWNLTL